MNNRRFKNGFEILFGIAFGLVFKWKVAEAYALADTTSVQITLAAAGMFLFYLLLYICRYFWRYSRQHGLFSYAGITGAAYVLLALLMTFFVHTSKDTTEYLKVTVIIWGVILAAYTLSKKRM